MSAAGTLTLNSVDASLRDDALMNLETSVLGGFLLDVDTDTLEELEALRFPNVLFQMSPLSFEDVDRNEMRFTFIGCPQILRWYK